MIQFVYNASAPEEVEAQLLVVPVGQEGEGLSGLSEALGVALWEEAGAEGFRGMVGQSWMLRGAKGLGSSRVLLVGAGAGGTEELRRAGAVAGKLARGAKREDAAIVAPSDAASLEALAEGFAHGAYAFDRYVQSEEGAYAGVSVARIVAPGIEDEDALDALDRVTALVAAVEVARDLVNTPPQDMTPPALADAAREIASVGGLECTIIEEGELVERGFNLIMAVGKGSVAPPRLIHLTYAPEGEVAHEVALVGKGVTFDTGGYNIKTGGHMLNMHSDMGGAAAVLGAAAAIAALQPSGVKVHFIVPTAENSVSGVAMRPNDIYVGYGKKSVEIHNTDAEGRLILADALAYAQEQGVGTIIDLATLTGACVVALGELSAGMFSADDGLVGELTEASQAAGESLWRMPLDDRLDVQLDSPVADMKNVGPRWGGAITAALFLRRWIGDGVRWAHLDVAGPAFSEGGDGERAHGGTGFGVATLARWCGSLGEG